MRKATKREQFLTIIDVLGRMEGNEDLVAVIQHEVELIDKRAAAPRKATAGQIENESLKAFIVASLLSAEAGVTATDIANGLDVTVQKASQLLRQLVAENKVARVEGKGKTKTTFVAV